MKLAIFSGQYFWFDGKHYSTDEAFVKFVTSFHPYFEKIIFCDALIKERTTQAYVLDPVKTKICPLPHFSVYSFWKNMLLDFPKIHRIIRHNIGHWDIVWLHAPHPVSLIFAYICTKLHKPFFLFVRQNLPVYVRCRNRGARKTLAVAVASALEYIFRRLLRDTLTFTVGKEIFDRYRKTGKRVHQAAVSLVSEKDISRAVFEHTPRDASQTRLLSVGRLDAEKGVIHLIQALDKLVANGNASIILDIVGSGTEEEVLRREVNRRGLAQYVCFRGYVSHTPQLLAIYRESDIFVLPSLTEGWPQTLFEAMACGVPVVATKVGGIPYLIEHGQNGLLTNPACSGEICKAVERIIDDSTLRDRLIRNGLSTVKNHTMEAERERMLRHIQDSLRGRFGENSILL